ncbi:Protein of unknown function [Pyronema omphalodes CBS 100304]|uniref:Uncharacterized protein n=1 Tax=Pyronema omphalodes (strain CBS 100304) TaxID=1076935 RepID=U4KUK8_PYROM|nr:Protein of unknown function [Pyronema omphalodes CBS 100304]
MSFKQEFDGYKNDAGIGIYFGYNNFLNVSQPIDNTFEWIPGGIHSQLHIILSLVAPTRFLPLGITDDCYDPKGPSLVFNASMRPYLPILEFLESLESDDFFDNPKFSFRSFTESPESPGSPDTNQEELMDKRPYRRQQPASRHPFRVVASQILSHVRPPYH